MAERRMFAKTIIDSDAFLDMPLSTQCLYFHLSMRADDDGFINNPKKIMRVVGASEDDLKVLMLKNFIITFDSGVLVIKHWRLHNYIRKDRKQETVYKDELNRLAVKKNGSYSLDKSECQPSDNQVTTKRQHRFSQVSIGKYSLGEVKDDVQINAPTVQIENQSFINHLIKSDLIEVDDSQVIDNLMHDMKAQNYSFSNIKMSIEYSLKIMKDKNITNWIGYLYSSVEDNCSKVSYGIKSDTKTKMHLSDLDVEDIIANFDQEEK